MTGFRDIIGAMCDSVPSLNRHLRARTFLLGLSAAWLGFLPRHACRAAEAPRAYQKRPTWHETMIASREATAGQSARKAEPVPLPDLGASPFTVMVWLCTTKGGTIFAKAPAEGPWVAQGKALFVREGRVCFDIGWVGCVTGKARVDDGEWHHVALIGKPAPQRVYIDGNLDTTGNLRGKPDPADASAKIGYTSTNFPRPSGFAGELDELRVYARALTEEEVKSALSEPSSASTVGLHGHWRFDGDGLDASGCRNHAVRMSKAEFHAGRVGKGLRLNGDGVLFVPSPADNADPNAKLWERLRRDFPGNDARQEMTWEREDGIWLRDWNAGDWADLARRYAAGSSRSPAFAERAAKLAPAVRDRAGLMAVRDLYLKSRRHAAVMAKLGQHNLDGLRAALSLLAENDERTKQYLPRLAALEAQTTTWTTGEVDPAEVDAWVTNLEHLRHAALVEANPLIDFDKLLFVKRYKYQSNHYYTDYINGCVRFGGALCVLDLRTGEVTDLAPSMGHGIFGRVDLSFDAKRIVFAWKGAPEEGFRIYEVGADGTGLHQLTFAPPNEAEMQRLYRVFPHYHHGTDDMDPCYLPDGGICFISTRCRYGILCDAPDDFTTTVLYRMDPDGKNIEKLTNSSVSEATPTVMNDGRILYTRWEYVDKGAVSVKCLWAMLPDGAASEEIYANDISLPPTFTHGRAIPGMNNVFVVSGVPHCPQNSVGAVIRLDMRHDIRTREPMTYLTPDVDVRAEGGFWHDANGKWGPHRLFKDPFPLSAQFFLVSMNAEANWKHPTAWGLHLLTENGDTFPLYSDPEIGCFQPLPLRPRPRPPILDSARDAELAAKNLAACIVSDVYRGLTGVERGEVKYLRVNEQVPRPWDARRRWEGDVYDQQHACITKDTHLGLKVQHGIVPVEADGSAYFIVPADKNIFLQALDENFMEVQRERTYVNYRPGEKRTCIGCHDTPGDAPTPREMLALRRPPSKLGPQPGEQTGARPLHFPTDVQPVLDRHCVKCHGGPEPQGDLDLGGTLTTLFSVSYENLIPERRGGTGRSRKRFDLIGPTIGENHPKTGNVHYLPAKSLGSHASVLVAMLFPDRVTLSDPQLAAIAERLARAHKDLRLPLEDRVRLTTWVDSNGQYYGSYYGRRNVKYRDHPNFRPVPTFASATGIRPIKREEDR